MALTLAAFFSAVPHGATVGVLGMPGTGKTRSLKEAAEKGALGKRVVVFDPYGRRDLTLFRSGNKSAHPWNRATYCEPRDLAEHPEEILDFETARIVVAPKHLDREQLGRDFSLVVDACWSAGDVALVADEAALYGRSAVDAILRIASGGRHAAMKLILVSQSLGRLPIDARRHLTHLVVFACGEPSDFDDLRPRCGGDFVQRVQRLTLTSPPELWKLGDSTQEQRT